MGKKVGFIVGVAERTLEELVTRLSAEPGIAADRAIIGATTERYIGGYDVLFDRMSHLVPHYRQHLRAAALAGSYVINDPFWVGATDALFALGLAARLGIPTARSAMLPQNAYGPGVDPGRHLKNLEFPLRWEAVCRYVKLPAVLRPADGAPAAARPVGDLGALWEAYNSTGSRVMMLQQHFESALHVRCLCIGGARALALPFDPVVRRYLPVDEVGGAGWLAPELLQQVVADSLALSGALGLDLNAVELAVEDGVGYVVDGCDPYPSLELGAVGERFAGLLVGFLVELCQAALRSPQRLIDRYRWAQALD